MTRSARPWTIAFWSLTLLALALRLFRLGENSFWIDEIASLRIISVPLGEVSSSALLHNAFEPPLFFWMIHVLTGWVGVSEVSLRVISAVAGALTIPVMWLFAREVTDREEVGALAAFLLALNPLHLWYSQEARPYALMVLFGSAALLYFARMLRADGPGSRVGFILCGALAMMSHVFGAMAVLVAWSWAALRRDRRLLGTLLIASCAIALLVAAWYVPMAKAVVESSRVGAPRPATGFELFYTVFTYLAGYSFGPSQRELQDLGVKAALARNMVQLLVAGLLLTLSLVLAVRRWTAAHTRLAILFAFPMVLAFVAAVLTGKPYSPRYTLLGLVGAVALLSLTILQYQGTRRAVLIAVFCGVSVWADAQWFWISRYWKEDSRGAVSTLAATLPRGALVAVGPAYLRPTLLYYVRETEAELCIVGVDSENQITADSMPRALLISRLHHLPRWRQIEDAYQAGAGEPLRWDSLPGYRMLFRAPVSGQPVASVSAAGC